MLLTLGRLQLLAPSRSCRVRSFHNVHSKLNFFWASLTVFVFLSWPSPVIVPQEKIRSQSLLNSGALVILCTRVLLCTVVVCCCVLLGVLVCCFVLLRVRGAGRSPCSYVV